MLRYVRRWPHQVEIAPVYVEIFDTKTTRWRKPLTTNCTRVRSDSLALRTRESDRPLVQLVRGVLHSMDLVLQNMID